MKDWELFTIEKDFLYDLAKSSMDNGGKLVPWEIQGQRIADKACKEKGFDYYIDIGGWVKSAFDEDEWSMPKPHLVEGLKEAQRKYKFMGKEYKFYLLWKLVSPTF
jgi:hypothetical protein